MNSVLLGDKNQNVRVHKQRKKKEKRENKEQGETKAIKQNITGIW